MADQLSWKMLPSRQSRVSLPPRERLQRHILPHRDPLVWTVTLVFTLTTMAWAPIVAAQDQQSTSSDDEEILDERSDDGESLPAYEATTTASGPRVTASETRVDHETLSLAQHRSAEELMRLVPGILIVQHGNEGKGYQFFVRGFDAVHGSDIEVRLEGIPLNEPSNVHANGYLDLGFIIPETVLTLNAVKGAFALDQGNFGTAATVDYTLGVPSLDRGTMLLYEVGTTNRHRLVGIVAPKQASDRTFIALEGLYDDGFGENRRTRRLSASAQGPLWGNGHAVVEGLVLGGYSDFGLPGTVRLEDTESGRVPFHGSYLDDAQGLSARAIGSLRCHADVGDNRFGALGWGQYRRLELDENYTGYLANPSFGDGYRQAEDVINGGLRFDYERSIDGRWRVTGQTGWQVDRNWQREDLRDADDGSWSVNRDLSFYQHQFFVAAGARWMATMWLDIEAGIRLDMFHYNVFDELAAEQFVDTLWQPSPRLTLTAYPHLDWTLFAAAGVGIRSPVARAITSAGSSNEDVVTDQYTGGTAEITAAVNAEIGARWEPGPVFQASVAGFGIWIEREVVFDHVSRTNLELNATRRYGVEADIVLRPIDWLDFRADVAWVDATFVESGDNIPGAPPLLVNFRLNVTHPVGVLGGAHYFYLAPRPLAHGAEAGGVGILDLMVGYEWRWLFISARLDNALDTDWREAEYHFASWWDLESAPSQIPVIHYNAGPPRTFRLTLAVTF